MKQDSHKRSLFKALTWRITATSTTMLIAWLITGETEMALKIGGIEFFVKMGVYYVHERLWHRVKV